MCLNKIHSKGDKEVRGGAAGWGTALLKPSGVDSASNRNEYQGYLPVGKGRRRIKLTTLPLSCVDCLEILGALISWSPKDLTMACTGHSNSLFQSGNIHGSAFLNEEHFAKIRGFCIITVLSINWRFDPQVNLYSIDLEARSFKFLELKISLWISNFQSPKEIQKQSDNMTLGKWLF
jgi:hypothetical protein